MVFHLIQQGTSQVLMKLLINIQPPFVMNKQPLAFNLPGIFSLILLSKGSSSMSQLDEKKALFHLSGCILVVLSLTNE